jgi:hypothetical protein
MLRLSLVVMSLGSAATSLTAATIVGTVIEVSKTGFVLQSDKGPKSFRFADFQLKGKSSPLGEAFDTSYRLRPADLKEGMEVRVEYRVVDTVWVSYGIRPYCARIDFAPLAKGVGKYTLHLKLIATDGTKLEKKYEVAAGTKVAAVRDMVQQSFQRVPLPKERWPVAPLLTNFLHIDGLIKDNKFSPIEKVEVSCPELKAEAQPEVEQRWKRPSK